MAAGDANNLRGPCSNCGAQLAIDQRYCVECGQRVGPPLALPYLPPPGAQLPGEGAAWGFVLPIPLQMASTFAAVALGFGVVVGTAISPNVSNLVAAGPTVVAQAPPTEPPASPPASTAPAPAAPAASAPTSALSTTSTPTSSTGGGGGGGGKHKKKKRKKKKPQTVSLSGTVVRVNPVAVSYALASGGALTAVHTGDPGSLPQVGDVVTSQARKLKNGTYAEQGGRTQQGTADQANFTGTVTFCADVNTRSVQCDGNAPLPIYANDQFVYTVSTIGASVLVRSPKPLTTPAPTVGSVVGVGVHIVPYAALNATPRSGSNACDGDGEANGLPSPPVVPANGLEQTSITATGAPATSADLEAVVQAVCPGTNELVLSADDVREAGLDLLPPISADGALLARVSNGQAVYATVSIGGGTPPQMTLTGITSDQGVNGADDPTQGSGLLTGLAAISRYSATEAKRAKAAKRAARKQRARRRHPKR